jgi:hypothetical protein
LATSAGGPASRDRVELEPLLIDVLDVGARLAAGRDVNLRLGHVEALTVEGDSARGSSCSRARRFSTPPWRWRERCRACNA